MAVYYNIRELHFTVHAKEISEAQDIIDGTRRSGISGKRIHS